MATTTTTTIYCDDNNVLHLLHHQNLPISLYPRCSYHYYITLKSFSPPKPPHFFISPVFKSLLYHLKSSSSSSPPKPPHFFVSPVFKSLIISLEIFFIFFTTKISP